MSGLNGHDRYAQAALNRETADVAATKQGRNDRLNRAGFALGQLVGSNKLDRGEVESRLFEAATACGHVQKHGPDGTHRTIASGLDKGMRQPRAVPETAKVNGTARSKPQPAPARPQASKPTVEQGTPDWTEPGEDGKPALFAKGEAEPPPFKGEARRHAYRRNGVVVRVKVKMDRGGFINAYRVRRPSDDVIGWQFKQPVGFVQVPYIGPVGCIDGFDPEMATEELWWAEGEKDVDSLQRVGIAAFTFGSASDVPDCRDLIRGRDVVIVGDNDDAGEKGIARKVEMARGVTDRIWVVRFPDLQAGGDVSDFLKAGGTVEQLMELPLRVEPEAPAAEIPEPERFETAEPTGQAEPPNSANLLTWYGDKAPEPPAWLIKDIVPRSQIVIVAGQYGTGKTFIADDLAACVMLGTPFAGREVVRQGGVLWLAAEGVSEVDVRIKAAATERNGGDPGLLPFARQSFDVPRLTAPEAEEQLLRLAAAFKEGLRVRFQGVELAVIVIDTLGSAAGWVDANSSSEAQGVMNMLRRVNAKTGALILVVDHYGKAVETGVMGASAKPQSAEVILAALSERDMAGNHSNRRMAVTKSRVGASGAETAFKLRPVPIDENGGTTCVIDWSSTLDAPAVSPKSGTAWTRSLGLFKGCVGRMLLDHGVAKRPFGAEGPEVRAVPVDKVRTEFIASYAADNHDAKKKQWTRSLNNALERELVATRDLPTSDVQQDWLWLTAKGEGVEE